MRYVLSCTAFNLFKMTKKHRARPVKSRQRRDAYRALKKQYVHMKAPNVMWLKTKWEKKEKQSRAGIVYTYWVKTLVPSF